MTSEQFKSFWWSRYPDTLPISHYFRHYYPDRWFRVHSLPKSKRYADSEAEWDILLNRQNTIISDVFGEDAGTLFVTGEYLLDASSEMEAFVSDSIRMLPSVASLAFVSADSIDLHQAHPEEHELGVIYQPLFSEQRWSSHKFDGLLKDIADDQARVLFIALDSDSLIAPYDGGMDLILPTTKVRDFYRAKYRDWLSKRADGL